MHKPYIAIFIILIILVVPQRGENGL